MNPYELARRLRLQALLARRLTNWRAVWRAYRRQTAPPALCFRSGHTLVHGPGDAPVFLFFEIFANGCYRKCVRLPDAGVVVDIGANVGAFVLDSAIRRPGLTFMAYEPNPLAFQQLVRNVEINRLGARVQVFNEAVSGTAGELPMWCGNSSLESSLTPPADASGGAWRTVRVVPLSTVVARAGRVALLKLDVEGAEADILEDAEALRDVEAVVGEHHDRTVPGTLDRVKSALLRAGFQPGLSSSPRCGDLFFATRA
jgi:FkbM family methyltransferase